MSDQEFTAMAFTVSSAILSVLLWPYFVAERALGLEPTDKDAPKAAAKD